MNRNQFRGALIALLQESVLIQGVITLTLIGTLSYMYVNSMDVPSELLNILLLILGFYFGGKVQGQAKRTVNGYENSTGHNSNRRHKTRGRG